jgi:PAS domain S-box-containing protein
MSMTENMDSNDKIGDRSVGRNVLLGFASIIILLLVSAGVSHYNTRQLYENTTRLAKGIEIQDALGEILSTMKDVETGQRGYVITGAKQFLDPYHQASSRIQAQIDRLQALFAEFPEQEADVTSLAKKIELPLALAKQANDLRDEKGFQAAQEFEATGQGKRAMDDIRSLIEQMKTTQRDSQRELERQCTRSYYVALVAHFLIGLLGVALVGVAFELVRRELKAHRRTMARLHEQREWLHVTLTSIGDAVIVTDAQGVVTFVNTVAGSLTGWKQDAVGQNLANVFRIIDEASRQPSENPVIKVLREGTVVGLANHTLLIARDGKEIAIDDSGAPIRDRHGRIDGVVLVFRDITARKHAEDALRRSEQELAEFFENATVGLHWVGPDGIILRVNAAELEFLGYTRAEYVGRSIIDFHVDADAIADTLKRLKAGTCLSIRVPCGQKVNSSIPAASRATSPGENTRKTPCVLPSSATADSSRPREMRS